MTDEQFIAALCVFREARGESMAAKTAILHVMRNRAEDIKGRWPRSLFGVVMQPWQFSSFNKNDPNNSAWPPLDSALSADYRAWQDCKEVVTVPLIGDPTSGANHYHSISDPAKFPKWADPAKETCQIGPFRFYRL